MEKSKDIKEFDDRFKQVLPHLDLRRRVAKRRYYAINILQRAGQYVHGYLKDYKVRVSLDKSHLNPRLYVEVCIDEELPEPLEKELKEKGILYLPEIWWRSQFSFFE